MKRRKFFRLSSAGVTGLALAASCKSFTAMAEKLIPVRRGFELKPEI